MLFVQMFHVMVVFVQAWFCVPKFRQNHLKSKLIFVLGNIFSCFPIEDNQSRSEKIQAIFQLILHNIETVSMFYLCLYISPGLPQVSLHQAYLVLPVVIANILAVCAGRTETCHHLMFLKPAGKEVWNPTEKCISPGIFSTGWKFLAAFWKYQLEGVDIEDK